MNDYGFEFQVTTLSLREDYGPKDRGVPTHSYRNDYGLED
jgi:hypothetical protein